MKLWMIWILMALVCWFAHSEKESEQRWFFCIVWLVLAIISAIPERAV